MPRSTAKQRAEDAYAGWRWHLVAFACVGCASVLTAAGYFGQFEHNSTVGLALLGAFVIVVPILLLVSLLACGLALYYREPSNKLIVFKLIVLILSLFASAAYLWTTLN